MLTSRAWRVSPEAQSKRIHGWDDDDELLVLILIPLILLISLATSQRERRTMYRKRKKRRRGENGLQGRPRSNGMRKELLAVSICVEESETGRREDPSP